MSAPNGEQSSQQFRRTGIMGVDDAVCVNQHTAIPIATDEDIYALFMYVKLQTWRRPYIDRDIS